jgi:hypothetical protein
LEVKKTQQRMKSEPIILKNNKKFLKLYPEEIQSLYEIYKRGVFSSPPRLRMEIEQQFADFLTTTYHFPKNPVADSIAVRLYEDFSSPAFKESLLDDLVAAAIGEEVHHFAPKITLSLEDYKRFCEISADFSPADPDTPRLKALLLSFVVFFRLNFHQTGWVRYDKKNIFHLAAATRLSPATQERLTNKLHTQCALDMRVVGSNQPIPCFNIAWLNDQLPPGSPDNPLVTLGDLSPEGIKEIISKIDAKSPVS